MTTATTAKEFYKSAYTAERAESLDKAFKFLSMALRSDGEVNKEAMAFKAALKAEREAFGWEGV